MLPVFAEATHAARLQQQQGSRRRKIANDAAGHPADSVKLETRELAANLTQHPWRQLPQAEAAFARDRRPDGAPRLYGLWKWSRNGRALRLDGIHRAATTKARRKRRLNGHAKPPRLQAEGQYPQPQSPRLRKLEHR